MSMAPPAIRDFARRLIAHEVERGQSPGMSLDGTVRVCARLRVSLVRLVGVAGFRSLLSRALALATADVSSLAAVQVLADGTLEGLDALQDNEDPGADGGSGVVIVAHLLQLLVTFIGEPLMLGLVRDAWPDAPGVDAVSEGQS